jgi:hypothetical protein
MPRQTKKQRAKIAKRFAIGSAVILILTFIVKEIIKENLKDLHDSLAQAETRFRTENGESTISAQILITQQQIENLKLQDEATHGKSDRDFSALIVQDTGTARQTLAQLNSDFDSVSRLIDALPSGAKDLRQLRDQARVSVDKVNGQVNEMLKPKPDHDVYRFVQVKMAMVFALLQEIPVTVLGDAALTTAHRVQDACEYLIRLCSRMIYFLGLLFLGLGLYAVITGVKTDASE